MIKNFTLKFLCLSVLFFGCSNSSDKEENSPMLRINWDHKASYTYFLFTPSKDTPPEGKGDYQPSAAASSVDYTWNDHDISLYGVALEERAIAHGISPEADAQGHLRLKRNGQSISLENQDMLIASPQEITCGRSTVNLSFQYATSLLRVQLEIDAQLKGYVFDLQLQAQKEGYLDLQKGHLVPEGQAGIVYFEQNATDNNRYETPFIPQVLPDNAVLSIIGIGSTTGEKVLKIDYPLGKQVLENNKQYHWTFTVSSQGIVYKNFSSSLRN